MRWSCMRREELYLTDIVEAADSIQAFLEGIDRPRFEGDDQLRSAVLLKLIVIGEAASRLPRQFTAQHPDVEWADIVGFRNIAVHAYFSVDWSLVWAAATIDAPELQLRIRRLLAEQSGRG